MSRLRIVGARRAQPAGRSQHNVEDVVSCVPPEAAALSGDGVITTKALPLQIVVWRQLREIVCAAVWS